MFTKTRTPFAGKAPIGPAMPDVFFGGAPMIYPQMPVGTPGPSPAIVDPVFAMPPSLTSPGTPSGGDADETAPEPIGIPFTTGEAMATPIVNRDTGLTQGWQAGDVRDDTLPGPRPDNSRTGTDPLMDDTLTALTGTGRE